MAHRRKAFVTVAASVTVILLSMAGWKLYLWLEYPYHHRFARELSMSFRELTDRYGGPDSQNEKLFGMAIESSAGNWDKVGDLSSDDDKTIICSYFHNLANAMRGELGEHLMEYYQPFGYGLFIPVDEQSSPLSIIFSDEVWYRLGEMTMAEHNAILGMIFSPRHSGPRFFRRLAEINLITGDTAAAEKYIALLGEAPDDSWKAIRNLVQKEDAVHGAGQIRPILKGLVGSAPDNIPAYEYLLCYDLLTKDLTSFIADYVPLRKECRLYQEAALIYMAASGTVNQENMDRFGITEDVWRDFCLYTDIYTRNGGDGRYLTESFHNTYWYYYHFARVNEKAQRH